MNEKSPNKRVNVIAIFSLLLIQSLAYSQVTLNANGPGNTYELITSVFAPGNGTGAVEAPDEAPDGSHQAFGRHIAEVFDAELNKYVFEFYSHYALDNDVATLATDRQRVEIKTYAASPANLIGTPGENIIYKWRFKLPIGFQPSTNFTHLHQIKAVDGDDSSPLFTLTPRIGTSNKLELIYVANATSGTDKVSAVDLSLLEGNWVDAEEMIHVGSTGTYSITLKKHSDGSVLMSYSNANIATIRPDNTFIRPKWGIYRSLNDIADLRDEAVRFSDFSIQEVSSCGVLSGTMYFWTHNTPVTNYSYSYNDYASYNLTGGIASAFAPSNPCSGCNAAVPNGKVGAGQSFFIQGLNNGVATFNNSMRFGVNAQFFKNNTNFSTTENNKNRIWLDLYNNIGLYKQILIGYLPNATNDYDTSFDGPIIDSDNPIMFYSLLNDKKLGIQGRKLPFNVNDEIPIGYKTTVSGNFEIKLSNLDGFFANQEVYLKDTYNNELFNLKNENYSFSTAIGTFEDRFKLLFINTTLSNTAFSSNSNSLAIYQSGTTVNLKSEGTKMREIYVYDIQGRLLNNFKNLNVSEFQFDNPYQKQILVIKIFTTDNNYFYRKI